MLFLLYFRLKKCSFGEHNILQKHQKKILQAPNFWMGVYIFSATIERIVLPAKHILPCLILSTDPPPPKYVHKSLQIPPGPFIYLTTKKKAVSDGWDSEQERQVFLLCIFLRRSQRPVRGWQVMCRTSERNDTGVSNKPTGRAIEAKKKRKRQQADTQALPWRLIENLLPFPSTKMEHTVISSSSGGHCRSFSPSKPPLIGLRICGRPSFFPNKYWASWTRGWKLETMKESSQSSSVQRTLILRYYHTLSWDFDGGVTSGRKTVWIKKVSSLCCSSELGHFLCTDRR